MISYKDIISSSLHLSTHVLYILLIFFLLQMLLEPSYQVTDVWKLLLMEVEAWTLDSDQFSYGFLVFVHVDEKEELWKLLTYSKVIVDMTAISCKILLDSIFDFFNSPLQKFPICCHILNKLIHRSNVFFDYILETVVTSVVSVFDSVCHVHCAHSFVFAFYLYVHYHFAKEFPCYH